MLMWSEQKFLGSEYFHWATGFSEYHLCISLECISVVLSNTFILTLKVQ